MLNEEGGQMQLLSDWAYNVKLGAFPVIAIVGFATYGLILITALSMLAKRWSKRLRRLPVKVHRRLALAAVLLATFHLLLGLATYA